MTLSKVANPHADIWASGLLVFGTFSNSKCGKWSFSLVSSRGRVFFFFFPPHSSLLQLLSNDFNSWIAGTVLGFKSPTFVISFQIDCGYLEASSSSALPQISATSRRAARCVLRAGSVPPAAASPLRTVQSHLQLTLTGKQPWKLFWGGSAGGFTPLLHAG